MGRKRKSKSRGLTPNEMLTSAESIVDRTERQLGMLSGEDVKGESRLNAIMDVLMGVDDVAERNALFMSVVGLYLLHGQREGTGIVRRPGSPDLERGEPPFAKKH